MRGSRGWSMVWLIAPHGKHRMPSRRRCRGRAQPFPALLPVPLVPGPALGYPAAGWTKPSRWGCGDLGGRVRQEPGLRNGSVPSPSEPLQPPSCGSRRVLRHESGQEKKRMNNGLGFLHGLRVPGTRSHTEQGDPLCPHRQRLQRERLRDATGSESPGAARERTAG